jgi:pimeloyl-ACP methyl ester carboxylesterase
LVTGRAGEFDIVERGTGEPLVLVPGVQGRWEYSRATVDALAAHFRVTTFSLWDERRPVPPAAPGIDAFARQVEVAIDRTGLERAFVAGVSFGGLVALRFAATRPQRTRALVMISAPGPQWHLRPRHHMYARLPWLFGPLFVAESPWRLRREVCAALPNLGDRRKYVRAQLKTMMTCPVSLGRMAARARLIGAYDRLADCRLVSCPTLVISGDDTLDHVTGSGGTADYATLIRNARLARLDRTGHLGSVTRPAECAAIIRRFLADADKDTHHSAA